MNRYHVLTGLALTYVVSGIGYAKSFTLTIEPRDEKGRTIDNAKATVPNTHTTVFNGTFTAIVNGWGNVKSLSYKYDAGSHTVPVPVTDNGIALTYSHPNFVITIDEKFLRPLPETPLGTPPANPIPPANLAMMLRLSMVVNSKDGHAEDRRVLFAPLQGILPANQTMVLAFMPSNALTTSVVRIYPRDTDGNAIADLETAMFATVINGIGQPRCLTYENGTSTCVQGATLIFWNDDKNPYFELTIDDAFFPSASSVNKPLMLQFHLRTNAADWFVPSPVQIIPTLQPDWSSVVTFKKHPQSPPTGIYSTAR